MKLEKAFILEYKGYKLLLQEDNLSNLLTNQQNTLLMDLQVISSPSLESESSFFRIALTKEDGQEILKELSKKGE